MDLRVILLLILEGALALFLLYRLQLLRTRRAWIVSALLLLAAFWLRAAALDYETLDYQNFLTRWVEFFRDNGGFRALAVPVGNYNIPYLYFLALFSLSTIRDLYLIKLLSILFDVLLAWACARLAARFTKSAARLLGCFFTVLFLPTVFLNGAVWGQCDSIYTALVILGIALALEDMPIPSMVCIALSFGFKLQAVFVMPVCAVLWMYGKYDWKHFLVFPLTYVILVLPAVLLGRPFLDTLTLYASQTGSIGSGLNYNSPSVFAVFTQVQDPARASWVAITAAAVYTLNVLAAAWANRKKLTDQAVVAAALLFAVGIPFLLPHMHDRYFFAADALSLALAFSVPAFSLSAVLVQFASLLGYHAYLKMRYLLPMRYGSAALILALALALVCFLTGLREPPAKRRRVKTGSSKSP
ncbi:MAG: DUF2029 domain-containing protein [Oscillospiraceae bacterium]|nr:DUF2029 domain-containing protein [Oscillospiraceae bacterium]